jgi:hypothetical protein
VRVRRKHPEAQACQCRRQISRPASQPSNVPPPLSLFALIAPPRADLRSRLHDRFDQESRENVPLQRANCKADAGLPSGIPCCSSAPSRSLVRARPLASIHGVPTRPAIRIRAAAAAVDTSVHATVRATSSGPGGERRGRRPACVARAARGLPPLRALRMTTRTAACRP